MIVEYWNRFGDSPLWAGLTWTIVGVFLVYVVFHGIHLHSVRGTKRAYQAASVLKTLCLPLFGAFVFQVAMDVFTSWWIGAIVDTWISYTLLRDWQKIKDSDDWWKGKGTKLKKKLRSLFSARSTAAAGAGA